MQWCLYMGDSFPFKIVTWPVSGLYSPYPEIRVKVPVPANFRLATTTSSYRKDCQILNAVLWTQNMNSWIKQLENSLALQPLKARTFRDLYIREGRCGRTTPDSWVPFWPVKVRYPSRKKKSWQVGTRNWVYSCFHSSIRWPCANPTPIK